MRKLCVALVFLWSLSLAAEPGRLWGASPAELAAHLESTLVRGSGVLFPDEDTSAALCGGGVVIDGTWPAAFLERIGETITVSVSASTGFYEFHDADGVLFWIEVPFAPLTSNWIAPFLHPFGDGEPDLLSPFRLAETWTLLDGDFNAEPQSRRAGNATSSAPLCLCVGNQNPRSSDPPSTLCFTAFSLTPSNLTFTADWPTNDPPDGLPPPDGILDLYCVTNLTQRPWALLHTETGATNPPVEFTISGSLVLGWNCSTNSHVHDATCPVVTNVVLSPLDGETVYTNIVYGCDYASAPSEAGFFRLGTRHDIDGDGLPDAYETLVLGSDPQEQTDALADADGDGLPNVYEWMHGTDPLVPDWDAAPKYTVGGPGADFATLSAAFTASESYDILEIQPGVYSGSGWTGLELPEHPVLVTSPDGGRRRGAVLRGTGETGILCATNGVGRHSVIQGLSVELSGNMAVQYAFLWGANVSVSGNLGTTGFFRSVEVNLGEGDGVRIGWFLRHSSAEPTVLASCVVDAADASSARGVYCVDSPEVILENCTFREFPDAENAASYGIQLESTPSNVGCATDPVPVMLRNCLFDASFTNALVLAPLTNGVAYEVTMDHCLVPSTLDYPPAAETGTVTAAVTVDRHSHLLAASSPAIGAGTTARVAAHDIDGEAFASPPSIGADEWSDGAETDSDGDGLTNADEAERTHTDPFLADTDGDGIGDGVEDSHGAAPLDALSFCFHCAVSTPPYPVSVPSDARLAIAAVDTNGEWTVVGESLDVSSVTNGVYDLGHCFVTNAAPSSLRLLFFLDADGDGFPGGDEVRSETPLSFSGHEASVASAVDGDADHDGMPDLWEIVHGFNPANALDAAANPDEDGLVNLHEYWVGCDPWTPDGSNTLLSAIATSIDSRIAGVTNAEAAKPMYNNYVANGHLGIFERNTNCWAHGIDLSCASLWHVEGPPQEIQGRERYKQPITLISPRHAIGAWHARPGIGWHYVFQATDGTTVTNKVIGRTQTSHLTGDICVCLLEDEMPPSFVQAKILPSDYADYIGSGRLLPVLSMDQENKAQVRDVSALEWVDSLRPEKGARTSFRYPDDIVRASLYENLVIGDSGRPAFLVIDSEVVLLCCWWYGGPGDGPALHHYASHIQAAMDSLCPGYSLEFFDLSRYCPLLGETVP